MANFFLGVDIGGTKSHAILVNETGEVCGYGSAGAGNWESVGYEGLKKSLSQIIEGSLKTTGTTVDKIAGAGLGIAGYDWPSQFQPHMDVIRSLNLHCPVELVNDASLGIPAGTQEGWGLSVVSGTGCNCRGWNQDRSRQGRAVGGHGHWSSEGAGGYDVIYRAMQAISFEWTHRGPPTKLTQAFMEKANAIDLDDYIEGVYLGKYRFDASYVLTVFEIAAQEDPEALNVARWAGDQLGQMANGVIKQVGLENDVFEVVQIGSLYNGHPLITEQMTQTIHEVAPKAQLVRLTAPPVVGGALLGMELVMGKKAYAFRDNVIETTQALKI